METNQSNTISKNNWTYWLNKTYESDCYYRLERGDGVSLCEYFWSTVVCIFMLLWVCIKWTIIASVCAVIAWIFIGIPVLTLFQLYTGWVFLPSILEVGFAVMVGISIIIILIGCLATKNGDIDVFPKWLPVPMLWDNLITKLNSGKKIQKQSDEKMTKEPNILVEFLKAKKQKFCPTIKLKTGE